MAQDEKNLYPKAPTEKLELAQLQVLQEDALSQTDQRSLDCDRSSSSLPTPATTPSKLQRANIPAVSIIPVWIILSSTVILYNNRVYNTYGFRYPVFLVTWHLTFAVSPSFFCACQHLTCLRNRPSAQGCFSGRPACLTASRMSTCPGQCS